MRMACIEFLYSSRSRAYCSVYWQLRTRNWLLFSGAQQIHIQPHRSGHARRQLAEEGVAGVDVNSLAIFRPQQPAFLRIFSRIVAAEQRRKVIVPLAHEVQTAFLHPSVEVAGRNLVRRM